MNDAHRPLGKQHSLAASLSYVETRQISDGHTIQFDNKTYRIVRSDTRARMRGADVRVEVRLDESLAVRLGSNYVAVTECEPRPRVAKLKTAARPGRKPAAPRGKSQCMKNFHLTSPEKTALAAIGSPAQLRRAKPFGEPGKNGPAIFALYLSKNRCSETSPKQMYPEKPKPPERATSGPV